ncbi:carboxypeptidase [Deinococcus irradiatisoli]|uniref:Carboxypeptidase n=1 Tax=Deinococcus irradiatisoli TaxID=2202254 RepID=A0A2Z3JQU5_9DEIO|nr:M20 family metallopeptidase [Deinococcus irradiatisoli]AWN23778.1 carboxypeptidase [Deinococcus irradiatisoli]
MTPQTTPGQADVGAEPLVSLLRDLKQLTELESPSSDPLAVCAVQDVVESWARALQARTHALPGGTRQFLFGVPESGGADDKALLVLMHADTVWPHGTLGEMPFRVEGERVYGPGTYDMKGGIVGLFAALRALQGQYPAGGIEVLLTPDEETGSHHSRAVIEVAAQRARAVLVVEPPVAESHALKTGRKGVGQFRVEVQGVAAHAGNKPHEGASAITEAARQVLAVQALADHAKGTTVSVGCIGGGGAVNVIPARAFFDVDVRVSTLEEGERVTTAMQELAAHDERVKLTVSGGLNRPPFERSDRTLALYAKARALAEEIGFDLGEEVVGGGSDGNFTAPVAPTLDGLGAPGDGAHAAHEHIRLDRWPDHVRLLTALLREL